MLHPKSHPLPLLPPAKIMVIQSSHIFVSGVISVNCSIVIVLILIFSYFFAAISVNFLLLSAVRTPHICIRIPARGRCLHFSLVFRLRQFFFIFYALLFLLLRNSFSFSMLHSTAVIVFIQHASATAATIANCVASCLCYCYICPLLLSRLCSFSISFFMQILLYFFRLITTWRLAGRSTPLLLELLWIF